ncbi:MAG: ABC transporter permease [Gemmatimonadaceae bacterium]
MADLAASRARSTYRPRDSSVAAAGIALTALAVWELGVRAGVVPAAFFPAPSAIARALGSALGRDALLTHLGATLSRVAAGLALGGGAGLLLGLLLGVSRRLRDVANPFVAAAHPVPKLALFPILILIFGLGEAPKVLVIAAAAFFPMLLNAMAGVRQINGIHFDVARVYGASRSQLLTRVVLPGSIPMVLTGVRLSANVAFLSAIAVEMVYAQRGLGALIWLSWQVLRVDLLYATLVVIAGLGVLLNLSLQRLARHGAPWLSERELTV